MFCLNIALGNTSWRLLFKEEEKANEAYMVASNTSDANFSFSIQDDFGQRLAAKYSSTHGVMLEDMDKTKMAHVEMALHQERTKVLATKMAQSDPGLRAAMTPQGPSIISPMPGSGRMA